MALESVATRARQNLGLVLATSGNLEEAARLEDRVIAESRAQGNLRFEGWTLIYRAQIALAANDAEAARSFAERSSELLLPSPPARAGALAVLARALISLGRATEALDRASEAHAVLCALGGIEEFESRVRLAYSEALNATRDRARDRSISEARDRVHERARAIGDARWRDSFL